MNDQKKTAVRAGTPATVSKNISINTINSILKNGGNVKVYIKKPGDLPRASIASKILPEFLSRKLKLFPISGSLCLVYEPDSKEPINIAFDGLVFRGTVLVVSLGFNKLYYMGYGQSNDAFVWLMKNRV